MALLLLKAVKNSKVIHQAAAHPKMSETDIQFEELKQFYPNVKRATDGGVEFILLPELELPPGCKPEKADAVLCPVLRDGYASRIFYPQEIEGIPAKNWNGKLRICDRNWVAYSWKAESGLSLLQMVRYHLYTLGC
jgi:hypothetical protein